MHWTRLAAALFAGGMLIAQAGTAGAGDGADSPRLTTAVMNDPAAAATVPALDHIAVVVMENRSRAAIMGNPQAPYINGLAASGTQLDNYFAVSHPSLPNYLALVGGDTFGITSDCTRCFVPARNLGDLLFESGITGKAYMEDMPAPCFIGSTSLYAQKHNPFMYFDSIRTDPMRCQGIVPYAELSTDLRSGQLPAFMWITPNMCHDMHDCSIRSGDDWLAQNLPQLLNAPAFAGSRSLLALTWDEDDGGSNRVPLILAGPAAKQEYVSHVRADHYSLLRTIEAAWSLPPLAAKDAGAAPLTDAFAP